jgi:hypothetical protein
MGGFGFLDYPPYICTIFFTTIINKKMNIDRSSYLFKIVFYHVSNICNEIMNQDDETSEKLGTRDARSVLEFTHMMGSFESIIDDLDALALKIVENVDMDILDDCDEAMYEHVYTEFLNNYKK